MDASRRRVGVRGSVVAAGSVWETRMKSDEVRGGVKVFNADENSEGGGGGNNSNNVGGTRLKRGQVGVAVPTGKRKTWKSESTDGSEKSPIQIARGKTEQKQRTCGEEQQQCKDVSNGINKSPIQKKLVKSEGGERSPIHKTRKLRSKEEEEEEQNIGDSEKHEPGDGAGKSPEMLRKSKSDLAKTENQSVKGVEGSIQLRETKAESDHESRNGIDDGSDGCGSEKVMPIENEKNNASDEDCKDFGVCQEKVISSTSVELSVMHADGDSDDDEGEGEEEQEQELEEEIDVKEIGIAESKVVNEPEERKVVVKEPQKKVIVVKEQEKKKIVNEPEPKKVVTRRFQQRNERPVSAPLTVNQSPPIIRRHSTIYQNFSKSNNSIPKTEECGSFPQTQSKLQSLVDLIMWRDISRSAFIFGFGTFVIVSSSYAKDINLSLISVTSYMGLVYLAVIFLYRSLICRGVIDVDNTNYVLGEEEAIWVLKLILPYLNEFLSRLRAMFSGDPGTTIKLAVLLFVLARCGSSITIWKMAKFGFFGVFTVPKICASYSSQLTAYGNFWIRRFRDAWDSCSHKKAVALGIFCLVWNLSSVVARIWAVFVLFVAFRYYQQHYLVREEWVEDEAGCDETWQEQHVGVGVHHRQGGRAVPNFVETNKVKKGF